MSDTEKFVDDFLYHTLGTHSNDDKLSKFMVDSLTTVDILSSLKDITGVEEPDTFIIDNNTTIRDLKLAFGITSYPVEDIRIKNDY
jgi:acyl carrier protein